MPRVSLPVLASPLLCAALTGCLPAAFGPEPLALRAVPASSWSTQALLNESVVPQERVLPLAEALERAPVGSVIVACQGGGARWGKCTHLTRKVSRDTLNEEPGVLGSGAQDRPLSSLLSRDLILVVDTGVRSEHLTALRAGMDRLRGAPYELNGHGDAFDCSTYQNELQRAMGLPAAVPLDPRWRAYLPLGVLSVPTNTLLWVGVRAAAQVRARQ